MLAILDYKAGNQTSVLRALRALGVPAEITADPSTILSAEGVIFPGVGAAGQAMAQLTSTGMDKVLKTTVLLSDIANFTPMNEVYAQQFSGAFPARSAFAVKELPKQALVEIEVIAVKA